MLYCIISIARVVDDNQFRKFIKRSEIASGIVRVYCPRHDDLRIKVLFAHVPSVRAFLIKNVIKHRVLKYV